MFPYKKVHKAIWRSPDNVTENQIDHICIAGKFKRSLNDVRVRSVADAVNDHHLLVVVMKLRLILSYAKHGGRVKYEVGLLEDTLTALNFQTKLQNRFQALQDIEDEDGTIDGR